MERKIGEIFEYNGEWLQCVEGETICSECDLRNIICQRDTSINNPFKECSGNYRTDKKNIIFKKLEKVGEPFSDERFGLVQKYKLKMYGYSTKDKRVYFADDYDIFIKIKQNKEDMEDNDDIRPYDELFSPGTVSNTKHLTKEDMEEKKLNLKPFDIQKAREGKPVCTRDGRKARIIAFDRRLFYKNVSYPILALVECSDGEDDVCGYSEKGKVLIEDGAEYKDDLMMLPEKKEGWINIYNADTTFYYADGRVFETKDEAVQEAKEEVEKEQREKNEYIDTIRVEWEE